LYTGPLVSSVQDTSVLRPAIALIVERCTQHDPEKRFQRVADLRAVWQNLHDETSLKTEIEELVRLRTALASNPSPPLEDIQRYCELIVRHLDDSDFVHDTVMQMSPETAFVICANDPGLMTRIITNFVDSVCAQGWPFGYTDKIGRKCFELYERLDDPTIRAYLIYCVAEVGVSHNRFYVINIMQSLFYLEKEVAAWMAIERRFLDVDESLRRNIGEHLNLNKLPSSIRTLLKVRKS